MPLPLFLVLKKVKKIFSTTSCGTAGRIIEAADRLLQAVLQCIGKRGNRRSRTSWQVNASVGISTRKKDYLSSNIILKKNR